MTTLTHQQSTQKLECDLMIYLNYTVNMMTKTNFSERVFFVLLIHLTIRTGLAPFKNTKLNCIILDFSDESHRFELGYIYVDEVDKKLRSNSVLSGWYEKGKYHETRTKNL